MQSVAYRSRHFWRLWGVTGAMLAVCLLVAVAGAFYVALLPHLADGMVGWPETFKKAPLILGMTAVVITVVIGVRANRLTDPDRNYLLLDEAGLTCMRGGKARFWEWRQVSAFEQSDVGTGRRQIRFAVGGAGTVDAGLDPGPRDGAAEGRTIAIDDAYDAPLEEILDRQNEFRTRNSRIG